MSHLKAGVCGGYLEVQTCVWKTQGRVDTPSTLAMQFATFRTCMIKWTHKILGAIYVQAGAMAKQAPGWWKKSKSLWRISWCTGVNFTLQQTHAPRCVHLGRMGTTTFRGLKSFIGDPFTTHNSHYCPTCYMWIPILAEVHMSVHVH